MARKSPYYPLSPSQLRKNNSQRKTEHSQRNFGTIRAPIIKVISGSSFKCTLKAQETFEEITTKLTQAPTLGFDACRVCIGEVLTQKGMPLAFFSEKLGDSRKKYPHMARSFMQR